MSALSKCAALGAALCLAGTGCFTVQHELPPQAVFGELPGVDRSGGRGFAGEEMKSWALAGLVPYSGWSSADEIASHRRAGERIEHLAIETTFSALDTAVWIFPGFVYGYYFWAPRTVKVSGTAVQETARR